ncbi:FmdE family protein [Desulfohalobium retbaense]|uniref:Formylmethanofuran dehydrogenase subunit E region n=1 Tax=Desulfohalobium retbaense (strain ATCC 49708 / DSM 5692 / JCM 16813 / HR100) TaxID=485915 RepID=C8X4T7_DESRD|nr:FmdE family protein [Desulfohalobium retbaense]ACV69434.1 formylmethanofuran dehydrogenase subunit E region [Desulfohalobium retbaense DSM 5692]
MPCTIDSARIEATIAFHGHWCPGVAIGIRAAESALRRFPEAADTDLVAVVETDMCGVDAIQFLTGCTLGKGNLIHRDYGKMAFSFFHRPSTDGIRVLLRRDARGEIGLKLDALQRQKQTTPLTPDQQAQESHLRQKLQDRFMTLSLNDLFEFQSPPSPMPRGPQIQESLTCAACGEAAMESRTRRCGGQTYCIPCFAAVDQKR